MYRDVDSFEDGARFPDAIAEQVAKSRVVLVLVGPAWSNARNAAGVRRLEDPSDWVRVEVKDALKRGVCVIPVTVGGATLPEASDLPEDIRDLVMRQARPLRDGDTWGRDMDLLVRRIAGELGLLRFGGRRRRIALWCALGVLAAAGLAFGLRDVSIPVARSVGREASTLETTQAARPPVAVWAGSWKSPRITDPDFKDQKFTLIVEFEMIGANLVGRVRDGIATFTVIDPQITGDSVAFYTQSEVTTGGMNRPYKQFYYGVRTGDTIRFRSWDDLGGTPFEFTARRAETTRR